MPKASAEMISAYILLIAIGLASVGFAPTAYQAYVMANSDLDPTSISYSPLGPQTGDSVTFSVYVTNAGSGSSDSSFKVSFFLDNVNIGNDTIPALPAGGNGIANFSWTATSELHDIRAVVDPDNLIAELNEGNNQMKYSIGVDWPTTQQCHDRLGYANTDGPLTNYVTWSKQLPAGIWDRAMVVADDKVFVGNRDGIYVYETGSGTAAWNITIGGGYQYPDAWMSVGKGMIFTGTDNTDNRVHALSASNGARIWNVSVGNDNGFAEYYQSMVISSASPNIYSKNADTGAAIWTAGMGGMTWASPAIYDDVIYSGGYNYNFTALNAQTGARLWSRYFGKWMYPSPSFGYGNVYMGISEGFGSGEEFYALNPANGSTVWSVASIGTDNNPSALHDGKVFFGGGTTVYARNASTGGSIWSRNIGGSFVATAPVISKNGVVYVASQQANVLYALNETDGSIIWSYNVPGTSDDGQPLVLALHDKMLFMTTAGGKIYAFGPKPGITASQTYNNTAVDMDSVNPSVPDVVPLTAYLSNNASGVSIEFYDYIIEPTTHYGSNNYLGSNTSVNGVATLQWNPNFPSSVYNGLLLWYGYNSNYNTIDNSTLRVYGGFNTSFKYSNRDTNATYNGTDNATVEAKTTFLGGQLTDDMATYNFRYNATFVSPSGARTNFILSNYSETVIDTTYLANSTGNSCYKSGDGNHYFDFSDDLIPTPIPSGLFFGSGYYLRWTCNSSTCPGYDNKEYEIMGSGNGGWNGLDYLQLTGWSGCTGAPGTEGSGWSFTVFTNNSVTNEYWNGTNSLVNESGTWTVILNATADWFYTNDTTSRTFNVTVPSNGTSNVTNVTGGEEAPLPIVYTPTRTMEMSFNGESFKKEGVDYVSVGRGSTGDLVLDLKNTGSTSLYGLDISATGAAADWVKFEWNKVNLAYNEDKRMLTTVDVPADAAPGEYEVTVGVSNDYVKYSKKFIIEVSAKCPVCAAAGEWSECVDGKRTRSISSCSSETDYLCVQTTAEEVCAKPMTFLTLFVNIFMSILQSFINSGSTFSDIGSVGGVGGGIGGGIGGVMPPIPLPPIPENTEAACSDGLDNDRDGSTDCADKDCLGQVCKRLVCPPQLTVGTGFISTCKIGSGSLTSRCVYTTNDCHENPLFSCRNNFDDDKDGLTDCLDPDCDKAGNPQCEFGKELSCFDKFDNDGDGKTDYTQDSDCPYVDLVPAGVTKTATTGGYDYKLFVKNQGTYDAKNKISLNISSVNQALGQCFINSLAVGATDSCTISINTDVSKVAERVYTSDEYDYTNNVAEYDV